jgi:hypothetical protein
MSHVTVQATLRARVLSDCDGNAGRTSVFWLFDPADPLAVHLIFADLPNEPWRIDRALLVHGGGIPNGDFHVERSGRWVLLTIGSPDGTAQFGFERDEVDALLAGAENLVPVDDELPEHVIDALIASCPEGWAPWAL